MDLPAFQSNQSANPATQETNADNSSIPPRIKNWGKWIFIFSMVLLVVTTVATFILFQQTTNQPEVAAPSPTPDSTAGWKTYANEKYGYSFKYPPAWNLSLLNDYLENPDPQFPDAGAIQSVCSGVNSCPFNLGIYRGNVAEEVVEFTGRRIHGSSSPVVSSTSDHGIAGKKIIHKDKNNQTLGIHYYYEKDGYIYYFSAVRIPNSDEIYQQALGILSTFRFNEISSSVESAPAPCDLNTDGQCDQADFALFKSMLGARRGDPNYSPLADPDADGSVTAVDAQLLQFPFPITLPVITPSSDEQPPCLADAKQCNDGSWVIRENPSCEFALCPGE